ncbi:hypothetical protein D3C77_417460 [compost metagenome]
MIIAMAIISRTCRITKVVVVVCKLIRVNSHIIMSSKLLPGMTSARGPNLSNSRPVIGETRPLSRPPGSRTSPAAKVVIRNTPCMRKGSRSIVENIVIIAMMSISVVSVNIGYLKTRKSSIGSFDFNCLITKSNSDAPPTIKGT